MHRVAITGFGIVSCLGSDPQEVSSALQEGKSGVVICPEREKLGFISPLTGQVKKFDPKKLLNRKQRKTMPDFAMQAYGAARNALDMAGIEKDTLQTPRAGLVFGCDSSARAVAGQVALLREHGETGMIGSGYIFQSMNSTVTMNLNVLLGTRGACWTLSSACSSGGHSIGQAADLIALGRQDVVVCGGAQEITWEGLCSFDCLGAFSTRTDRPAEASRPFDRDRDGLVPGGGAAVLVLERMDLAQKRGAEILGEVSGYGFSSDGGHISVPSREGLGRAMNMALDQAELNGSDIDYLCAHATSTPEGDRAEAYNILGVFGDNCPPLSSLKSMTGHELWMSGASQVVYSLLMAREKFLAPNINYSKGDEITDRLNIITETRSAKPGKVLCNSAGFGGTNCSLVIRFDQ